jgi:hypothetical protein
MKKILVVTTFIFLSIFSVSAIANEANIEMNKFFEQIVTKCGSSYLSPYLLGLNDSHPVIVETKGTSFIAKPQKLTESDTLNGINWKGYFILKYTSRRMFHIDEEWQPPLIVDPYEDSRVRIENKNGIWMYSVYYLDEKYQPIDSITIKQPSCDRIK